MGIESRLKQAAISASYMVWPVPARLLLSSARGHILPMYFGRPAEWPAAFAIHLTEDRELPARRDCDVFATVLWVRGTRTR